MINSGGTYARVSTHVSTRCCDCGCGYGTTETDEQKSVCGSAPGTDEAAAVQDHDQQATEQDSMPKLRVQDGSSRKVLKLAEHISEINGIS